MRFVKVVLAAAALPLAQAFRPACLSCGCKALRSTKASVTARRAHHTSYSVAGAAPRHSTRLSVTSDPSSETESSPDASPSSDSKQGLAKLRGYGLAGVLAYGGLNGLYYSIAFTLAWYGTMASSNAPAAMGVAASFRRFFKVSWYLSFACSSQA
jgi:hypothetical protein